MRKKFVYANVLQMRVQTILKHPQVSALVEQPLRMSDFLKRMLALKLKLKQQVE